MIAEDILNQPLIFTILIVLSIATLIQLAYHWIIFGRLAFYRPKQKQNLPQEISGVSVVIAAKNEYNNLKRNLPLILEQNHPDFEVIVVNNYSDDDSTFLLKMLAEKYKHLHIVEIKKNLNFFDGKKFPLSMGIKTAHKEHLILTDADCRPTSKEWLRLMEQHFSAKTEIVLGYGPYAPAKGVLNRLIRFETITAAMQYFSLALIGMPYMGVGRNLAYKKSLFYKQHGFTSHYNISSGDDDLFVNKVANKQNTRIEISPESHMISPAKIHFSQWWRQKKRHFSTSGNYKGLHKFFLSLMPLSLIAHYIAAIILIIMLPEYWYLFLSFIGLRLISSIFILKKCMYRLNEKHLLLISPILELLLLFLHPIVAFSNLFSKQRRWN